MRAYELHFSHNFATGESEMTAEAGQTSTKISIVNNNLNNDKANLAAKLNVDNTLRDSANEDQSQGDTYLTSVPIPAEWREQVTASHLTKKSPRTNILQWPPASSIVSRSKPSSVPVYTQRVINLALRVYHRRRSLRQSRAMSTPSQASGVEGLQSINKSTQQHKHPDSDVQG